jgi:hypothetical protein
MAIKYPKMGICGLSCQLCPMYHTDANSRCEGCKSKSRMTLGCPFITCAINKRGLSFAGNAGKVMIVKSGGNIGKREQNMIHSSVIKS